MNFNLRLIIFIRIVYAAVLKIELSTVTFMSKITLFYRQLVNHCVLKLKCFNSQDLKSVDLFLGSLFLCVWALASERSSGALHSLGA